MENKKEHNTGHNTGQGGRAHFMENKKDITLDRGGEQGPEGDCEAIGEVPRQARRG